MSNETNSEHLETSESEESNSGPGVFSAIRNSRGATSVKVMLAAGFLSGIAVMALQYSQTKTVVPPARAAIVIPGCEGVDAPEDGEHLDGICCPAKDNGLAAFVGEQCKSNGNNVRFVYNGTLTFTGDLTPSGRLLKAGSSAEIFWQGDGATATTKRMTLDLERSDGQSVTIHIPFDFDAAPGTQIATVEFTGPDLVKVTTSASSLELTGELTGGGELIPSSVPQNSVEVIDLTELNGISIPFGDPIKGDSYGGDSAPAPYAPTKGSGCNASE